MTRRPAHAPLNVFLNGRFVGDPFGRQPGFLNGQVGLPVALFDGLQIGFFHHRVGDHKRHYPADDQSYYDSYYHLHVDCIFNR